MKVFFCRFLIVFIAVWGVAASHAQTVSNTGAILFYWADFGSRSNGVNSVSLTPIAKTLATAGTLRLPATITYSKAAHPEMTNGSVTVSNVYFGYALKIALSGTDVWYYTNCIPTNEVGNVVNATDYGGVSAGQTAGIIDPFAYFNPVLNAQFSNSVVAIVSANASTNYAGTNLISPAGLFTENGTNTVNALAAARIAAATNGFTGTSNNFTGSFTGSGAGLTNLSSFSNLLPTNYVFKTGSLNYTSTNPIWFVGAQSYPCVNTNLTWNPTLYSYTNRNATNTTYAFWEPTDETWYVGNTNINDGSLTGIYYGAFDSNPDPSITIRLGVRTWYDNSGSVLEPYLTVQSDYNWVMQTNQAITSSGTNASFVSARADNGIYWDDVDKNTGKTLFTREVEITATPNYINGRATYWGEVLNETNYFNFFSATNNWKGGIQIYRQNGSSHSIVRGAANDYRGFADVAFLYGTNGNAGVIREVLVLGDTNYYTANQIASSQFHIAAKFFPDGAMGIGNFEYTNHAVWTRAPALLFVGSAQPNIISNRVAPQFLLLPSYAPTVATNGAFYSNGTNIFAQQKGVSLQIPMVQAGHTNGVVAAASLTIAFSTPMPTTNYVVGLSGSAAIVSPLISARTTNGFTTGMTAFTGNICWTATLETQ